MDSLQILQRIAKDLEGATAPRPSGQLSGHAGGLVFEELAHEKLVRLATNRAFRHYEALNVVLEEKYKNGVSPKDVTFGTQALHYLVARGKEAVKKWKPTTQFEEKQNDTAESILFENAALKFDSPQVSLIDVKSQNATKKAQPPNIISARKLYNAAELILRSNEEPNFNIIYLNVKFLPIEERGTKLLEATECRAIDLFKMNPANLYINWSAALQIQFEPSEADQSFEGSRKEWFEAFVRDCYSGSLRKRIGNEQEKLTKAQNLLADYHARTAKAGQSTQLNVDHSLLGTTLT